MIDKVHERIRNEIRYRMWILRKADQAIHGNIKKPPLEGSVWKRPWWRTL